VFVLVDSGLTAARFQFFVVYEIELFAVIVSLSAVNSALAGSRVYAFCYAVRYYILAAQRPNSLPGSKEILVVY
jgi:hypothetical protein